MLLAPNTSIRFPVRLVNISGHGVTGIVPADITDGTTIGNVTFVKGDSTTASLALTVGVNFFQVSATNAPGLYHILVPASATNVVGTFQVVVLPSSTCKFLSTVVTAQVSTIVSDSTLIRKILTNRYKIWTSGPDINRWIVYDDDNTTPLIKFNLFNDSGAPTTTNPYERVKVP